MLKFLSLTDFKLPHILNYYSNALLTQEPKQAVEDFFGWLVGFFHASFNELGSIWTESSCLGWHHTICIPPSPLLLWIMCLLQTEQKTPWDKTLEIKQIIYKCCDFHQLIPFHNCSPNNSFHIKILLVKPFSDASLILIKFDSAQETRELRYQIQNDKSAVCELSPFPFQI